MGREVVQLKSSKQDQTNEHFTYNEREEGVIVFTLVNNLDPIPKGRGHHKIRDSRKVYYVFGTNDMYRDLKKAMHNQLPNMGSWFDKYIPYDFEVWPIRTSTGTVSNGTLQPVVNHQLFEKVIFNYYVRKYGVQKVRSDFFKADEPPVVRIDQILDVANLKNDYSTIKFPPTDL